MRGWRLLNILGLILLITLLLVTLTQVSNYDIKVYINTCTNKYIKM